MNSDIFKTNQAKTYPFGFDEGGKSVDPLHDEDFMREGSAKVSGTGEWASHKTGSKATLGLGDLVRGGETPARGRGS